MFGFAFGGLIMCCSLMLSGLISYFVVAGLTFLCCGCLIGVGFVTVVSIYFWGLGLLLLFAINSLVCFVLGFTVVCLLIWVFVFMLFGMACC